MLICNPLVESGYCLIRIFLSRIVVVPSGLCFLSFKISNIKGSLGRKAQPWDKKIFYTTDRSNSKRIRFISISPILINWVRIRLSNIIILDIQVVFIKIIVLKKEIISIKKLKSPHPDLFFLSYPNEKRRITTSVSVIVLIIPWECPIGFDIGHFEIFEW